jgi:hypothetical protein
VVPLGQCSQAFLLRDPFRLQKITMGSDIIAHINTVCPDDKYPKLKVCVLELIVDRYEYTSFFFLIIAPQPVWGMASSLLRF